MYEGMATNLHDLFAKPISLKVGPYVRGREKLKANSFDALVYGDLIHGIMSFVSYLSLR